MASNFIIKLLYGNDIFVSYRWSDLSKRYVVKLVEDLEKRGFSCYVDQNEMTSGEIVPKSLRNAIRTSRMFVLVATEDLDQSTWVPQELALAEEFGRQILPVNVNGAIERLPPADNQWDALKDRSQIEESFSAFENGFPSPHVPEKIDQSFAFTRKRVTAIRVLFLLGLIFFGVSTIAAGAAIYAVQVRNQAERDTRRLNLEAEQYRADIEQARNEKQIAETEKKAARNEQQNAERSRDAALAEKKKAQGETEAANAAKVSAQSEMQIAKAETVNAEQDRDKAEASALEKQQLSNALDLANRAEIVRDELNNQLPASLLLAAESVNISPTLAGGTALRSGLALMPRLIARMPHRGEARHSYSNPRGTFSPDGRFLVTLSNKEVLIWKAGGFDAGPISRLPHDDRVYSFAFNADGKYLVTTGEDGAARVWENWNTAIPLNRAVLRHDLPVVDIAFDPAGGYLAICDKKRIVHFWKNWHSSTAAGQVATSTEPTESVYGKSGLIAFNADASQLFLQVNDRHIHVIETASGRRINVIANAIMTPDKKFIISDAKNNTLVITAIADGRTAGLLKGVDVERFMNVAIYMDYNDTKHYLAFEEAGNIYIYRTDNGTILTKIPLGSAFVGPLSLSPDGSLLANVDRVSRVVRIWNTTQDTKAETARLVSDEKVNLAVFSPDGGSIATIADSSAQIWTTSTYDEERKIAVGGNVSSLIVSPDERYLAVADDSKIYILNAATGETVLKPFRVDNTYTGVTEHAVLDISRDGRYLAVGGYSELYIYTDWATSPRKIGTLPVSYARKVKFSPDGEYLVAEYSDSVALWNKTEWNNPRAVPMEVPCHSQTLDFKFSLDGKLLVVSCFDGTVRVWENWQSVDRRSSSFVPEVNEDGSGNSILALAISQDDRYLATSTGERIYVWENWKEKRKLVSQMQGLSIRQMVFSPDMAYLAGTNFRSGSVWRIDSGSEVARVPVTGKARSIAFDPEGKYLIIGGSENVAGFWLWRPGDLLMKTCEYLENMDMNLDKREWYQSFGNRLISQPCAGGKNLY